LEAAWHGETPVLCIAGRTGLDEAAASMLAQMLSKHGIGARVEGANALSPANIFRLETKGIEMACVSFLDTSSIAHMRFVIRRLRRTLPDARIILGCWMMEGDLSTLADAVKADGLAVTLRDAASLCLDQACVHPATENILPEKIELVAENETMFEPTKYLSGV